mgnify:CR=1 FL=1
MSYNPGYQNAVKDLKHSTRQRFVAIEFDFPDVDRETKIIAHESGLEEGMSNQLAVLGQKIRNSEMKKIPVMIIVGDKEIESNTVSVRTRSLGDLGSLSKDELIEKLISL